MLTPTVLLMLALASTQGQVNEQALRGVAAGTIKVARASWWGFDPQDSTRALQAALDSGVPKLIVDNLGAPWIVEPISLRSNQEILFEPGVEVLAKRGAFRGSNDCLFSATLLENLTLRGYGATLRMRRSDYAGPPYQKAEWRHVLQFKSCRRVRVYGLTLAESGGDGIYLGAGQSGVSNQEVHIRDVICDRNYRQGISVITAENLLIENCVLRDTAGTAPQSGIDFEPNLPGERLVNCVMRHCLTQGNRGDGYQLYLNNLTAASAPVSLRFENCRSLRDHGAGVRINTANAPQAAVRGIIEFSGCRFEENGRFALVVADKPAAGCRVRFDHCEALAPAASHPEQAPLLLLAGQNDSEPIGGVELTDLVVRDALQRRPLGCIDAAGVGVRDLTGRLILEREGKREGVALTGELLAEWMPTSAPRLPRLKTAGMAFEPVAAAPVPAGALEFVRLRERARLALYARQGDEVRLRVLHGQVAQYDGTDLAVVVLSPSGAEIHRSRLPFREETEIRFTSATTGVYRVAADPSLNYVQVIACSHPLLLSGESGPVHLYLTTGALCFWVPAGTREFALLLSGEGMGEGIRAALLNPRGEVVQEADNIVAMHAFEVALPQPSAGEAWTLRLARPTRLVLEDCQVDLRGIPALLAAAPEALLKPIQP